MMDVVALAILLVIPALAASVWLARVKRNYLRHKQVQLALSLALAVVLGLFEAEVRRHPWTDAAAASPFYATWLFPVFYVHLTVAVTTTALWVLALATALARIPKPPRPGPFSRVHRRLGQAAAIGLAATAVTGWTFFWVAFLA
jgi:hypothetical protein